jgi:two-component system, cell cycle sensor histidine kinase and response regulator CckA
MADRVTLVDEGGRFMAGSSAIRFVLGYGPDELVGQSALELVHPEDRSTMDGALTSLLASPGSMARVEARLRHANGEWRWLDVRGRNLLHDPAVGGIVIDSRDVTDRRESQEALRRSEERFRLATEHAPIGISLVAPDGTYLHVNPALCKILGYDADELKRLRFQDITHPEDQGANEELGRALVAGELESGRIEKRYIHKEGHEVWARLTVTLARDEDGDPLHLVGLVEDITRERRLREEEAALLERLERERDRLSEVFELAPSFLAVFRGRDHIVEMANEAHARLVGRRDIIGQPFRDALPEIAEQGYLEIFDETLRTGQPKIQEEVPLRFHRPDGSTEKRYVTVVCQRVLDSRTGEPGIAVHGLDVTDHVLARRHLKEAGAQARRSEHRYRAMFERAAIGIAFVRPDNTIVNANRELERFTGYSAAELKGRTLDSLLAPDSTWDSIDDPAAGHDDGGPVRLFRRKDGDLRWGSIRLSRLEDPAELPFAMAMVADVHEQKLLEEAVWIRERHFRSLIEKSVDVISIMDEDGTILYESPAITAMTGYHPKELIGRNGFDLVHPADHSRVMELWKDALNGATGVTTARFRLRHRDGTDRRVEVTATNLLDDPAVGGVVVNLRDIHERMEAERQVRFQAQLMDVVNQAIVATDREGRLLYWNRFAETLHGWRSSEVLGRPIGDVLPIMAMKAEAARIMEDLLAGASWAGEFPVRRRDGSEFTAAVTASPITDEKGKVVGVVSSLTDLTERKKLEAQLLQSQKMEAVGRLAGGVAHDFNNLLTAIRGYTEFLLEDLGEGAARSDVEEIQNVTERAVGLTRQLLVFSKRQISQPEVLDVNTAIGDLRKMLGRLLGEDIDLRYELGAGLPCIHVDRAQLEQVVMNLLLNARDAMPEGGRIVMETGAGPGLPPAGAETGSDLGYVTITVTDTGVGIAPDVLPHIFEPFFSTKGAGGTGLGLSTVYAITDQAGGDVRVESKVGEGTEFTVRFPAVAGAPTSHVDGRTAHRDGRGTGTILMVEDEANVRMVVRRTLEQHGYQVLEADNSEEALRAATEYDGVIHLLLTDVVLPGMSGPALADLIQAGRPDTPVLFMSGYTEDALALQRIVGQDAPFLAKPFTPDAVLSRVAETMRSRDPS